MPIQLPPRKRRVVQAILYELIAVLVVTPILAGLYQASATSSLLLSLLISSIALVWNYTYNGWFEGWERRQSQPTRTWQRRFWHGLGFEGGLACFLVPLTAMWLNISLLQALILELGFLLFFFVYAIAFTWAFDQVFALPSRVG